MSAQGGSTEALIIDGRHFSVPADADFTTKLGGYEIELQPNGDRTVRRVQTWVPWSMSGGSISIDPARGDQEFIEGLALRPDVPIAKVDSDGIVYQGTGTVTGEKGKSSQSATMTIELGGPGKLTPQ